MSTAAPKLFKLDARLRAMLRDLAPFYIVALMIAIAAGIAYSTGVIGTAATYGLATIALLVAAGAYARWDSHQPRAPR